MSSSATATKVTATRSGSDAGTMQQSTLYKGIMTPIIFVSFLLSLVWVDLKYTLKRSRGRGHHHGGWMPSWLHSIVYRHSPYTYMQKESTTPNSSPRSSPREEPGEFYYHSKQKKLMRMEMDDAFEVRGQVLVVVGAASLATLWGFWITRPGVLHGTSAPLDNALRTELYAAIEAIYAAGGSDTSSKPAANDHHQDEPDAASRRLSEVLKFWSSRIEARNLLHQRAFYHLHPPANIRDFESWVLARDMCAADAALVARLRCECPKAGFEVLPVVLEYTGTACQYNAWVSKEQSNGHASEPQIGEDGFWKTYQHVRHTPHVYQFRGFSGANLAEEIDCKEGNVLDERNIAWERARRGLFFWQGPQEQRYFDEERQVRENNPKWYQKIVPGTTADLGKYFAPVGLTPPCDAIYAHQPQAIMIVPTSTQLDLVDFAENPQPYANVWWHLLKQCEAPVKRQEHFEALEALCDYVFPKESEAPAETRILGMRVSNREDWIKALDPLIMGDLIVVSLVFRAHSLFERLAANTPVHPTINYDLLCQNADRTGYPAAKALGALRRFFLKNAHFLQVAAPMNKMPADFQNVEATNVAKELINEAMTLLKPPVTANHGRVIADFLKFFENFDDWHKMVNSAVCGSPELRKQVPFILGLLNRLLDVAKRKNLPLDQVKMFYNDYKTPIINAPPGLVSQLISNVLKDDSTEAQTARQTWCEGEPSAELLEGQSQPPPTSFTLLAGLFKGLDRLDMTSELSHLVMYIVHHQEEIRPIHMAPLWLPCLKSLHDLVDPSPAFQKLFQAIFGLYHKMVFDDASLQFEDAPSSITPLRPCCADCKYLDAYFEQPNWKKFHLVKPKKVIDHIQEQLRQQRKPIETTIFGKNEMSITMQLNKVSLVNKELGKIEALRRQEASRTVRQFEPSRLLPFLGDKGDIMWKLGDADCADPVQRTPARPSLTSASGSGLSRTSSSSSANTSVSTTTPSRSVRETVVKREPGASARTTVGGLVTPKTEPRIELSRVKTEHTPSSSSQHGQSRSIRDMFASVKKEKTPGSAQARSGLSTRDRLKNLQPPRREQSTPKFNDYSKPPMGSLDDAGASSSSKAPEPIVKRDPLASFGGGGTRNREPVRNGIRKSGLARDTKTAPLLKTVSGFASRHNAIPGLSTTSPLNTTPGSSASTSRASDFMSAVLDAEKARKKRSSKSTWEVKTAAGNVVSAGTSSAMAKSRFDGLAKDKENTTRRTQFGTSAAGRAANVLSARSPNIGGSSASTASKRKADDDLIDLCGSSPERASKRKKSAATFDPFEDDDPFADM
ncbi:hypothetical protein K4K54_007192 [Colletotrichum sp. SAR 10_86]|nr:hypothetical protein K4K54_007192 [Colletotrichum sp. SAR 10_86]